MNERLREIGNEALKKHNDIDGQRKYIRKRVKALMDDEDERESLMDDLTSYCLYNVRCEDIRQSKKSAWDDDDVVAASSPVEYIKIWREITQRREAEAEA